MGIQLQNTIPTVPGPREGYHHVREEDHLKASAEIFAKLAALVALLDPFFPPQYITDVDGNLWLVPAQPAGTTPVSSQSGFFRISDSSTADTSYFTVGDGSILSDRKTLIDLSAYINVPHSFTPPAAGGDIYWHFQWNSDGSFDSIELLSDSGFPTEPLVLSSDDPSPPYQSDWYERIAHAVDLSNPDADYDVIVGVSGSQVGIKQCLTTSLRLVQYDEDGTTAWEPVPVGSWGPFST